MQVNVEKGGPANNLTLALAFEEKIDILLIQKPWINTDLDQRLSKKHGGY